MNKSLFPQRMSRRALAALLLHAVVFAGVYFLAYSLKFDLAGGALPWTMFFLSLPAVLVVKLAAFYWYGHCHRSWHYLSFSDLSALLWSATLSSLVITTLDKFLLTEAFHLSTTILVLDWALTVLVLGGLRALVRLTKEEFRPRLFGDGYRKALIVGANNSGETLARHILADHRLQYRVQGFIDADCARHGSTINGIPVLGSPENLLPIAGAVAAEDILVISGVLPGPQLRDMMDDCRAAGLTLKVIPALEDLLEGDYSVQIRDVDINDLLRREPVQLSGEAISSLVAGRVVMVTGAGGSIGAELCRQVLKFRPQALLMVERTENSLFAVEQEFRVARTEAAIHPLVADITDPPRIEQLFRQYQPQIVFHAAAHKHVPMMEHNPGEAIKNNVLGTQLLAELADRHHVEQFVMISTDKAVNPTSVMGVSKHLAERFVHAYSDVATTKFVVVRFGNVLASNGSVVPIFQEQIRRGGPVTVTHPEIERFFMTIPEATQLVLQAAAMGKGGEIFVLDMGQSVRIVDLARDLIRLSGLTEDDVEIVFTGLRPGEKLYEELYFDDEEMQPTPHPKVFVAYHRPYALGDVRSSLAALIACVHEPASVLRAKLKELVPEYILPGDVDAPAADPKAVAAANGHAEAPPTALRVDAPVPNGKHPLPQRSTAPAAAAKE